MDTIQITISTQDEALRGMLIAALSEEGFDAFEETENALLAYCEAAGFKAETVDEITQKFGLQFRQATIAQQNWNAAWEASYAPVMIDDFCMIRAAFHAPVSGYAHDIVITPKMSFGTGHHATTTAMIRTMRGLDFKNKKVLDFGAGTGILAILASKLGAAEVLAIDHEEWAAKNAEENVALNGARGITIKQGSFEQAAGRQFGIILANINRHILVAYMAEMAGALLPGGALLLSGILTADEAAVEAAAISEGLQPGIRLEQSGWLALSFRKEAHRNICPPTAITT